MTNRIDTRLAKAAAAGRPALAPFLTVGFPDVETSTRIAEALLDGGADVLELGVPFSDPLAEGPTIQRSSLHALRQGVTFDTCLRAAGDIRRHNDDAGLLFMGYYNPLLRYGLSAAADSRSRCGVRRLHRPRPARRGVRSLRRPVPPPWAAPHTAPCADEHGRTHSFGLRTGRRLHILR